MSIKMLIVLKFIQFEPFGNNCWIFDNLTKTVQNRISTVDVRNVRSKGMVRSCTYRYSAFSLLDKDCSGPGACWMLTGRLVCSIGTRNRREPARSRWFSIFKNLCSRSPPFPEFFKKSDSQYPSGSCGNAHGNTFVLVITWWAPVFLFNFDSFSSLKMVKIFSPLTLSI